MYTLNIEIDYIYGGDNNFIDKFFLNDRRAVQPQS